MIKVYIECSTTLNSNANTGIQRVVRKILTECKYLSTNYEIKIVKVGLRGGRIIPIKEKIVGERSVRGPMVILMLYAIKFINDLSRIEPLRKLLTESYKYYISNLVKWLNKKVENKLYGHEKSIINLKEDNTLEILLLLDSTWSKYIWDDVDKFRKIGGHVCAVLYDLIPFSHPETVDNLTLIRHTSWWSQAPNHLDSIMCISQTVRDEYIKWQDRQNIDIKINQENIGYFYLGADFQDKDEIINIINDSRKYYLMVGTIEPRKNHEFILEVFDKLWIDDVDVSLVLVGAKGWKIEKLIEKIENHKEYNSKLIHIDGASDMLLYILYRHCMGLIVASKVEGFGLPIIEGLTNNVPVFCSDIPVFREIGGGNVNYFRLDDTNDLAEKIYKNISEQENMYKNSVKTNDFKWKTWSESAEELLLKTINIAKKLKIDYTTAKNPKNF